MIVKCDATKCVFNENELCERARIEIVDCECPHYEDYTDTDDYKSVYFCAISGEHVNLPDKAYKERAHGKKLIINGIKVYTKYDDREEDFPVTEEKTGFLVMKSDLIKRIDEIKKKIENATPVVDYKEIVKDEYDATLGNFVYRVVEEPEAAND